MSGRAAPLRAPHRLSDEEAREYRSRGFLVRQDQFDGAELAALIQAVEDAAALALARSECAQAASSYVLDGKRFVDLDHITVQFEPPPFDPAIKVIEPVCDLHPLLDSLLDDPRLTAPMRDILGSESIGLWTNKLNLKRPQAGSGFGWHQDSPYWIHDCSHVDLLPNVMVVLDDAHRANGCFEVIRGSHREGCLPGTNDGSQLGGFYTDPERFDPAHAVALEVPAGSLIFFDPHIVHGSGPNSSETPRRALILTYQPAGHPTLKSRQVRGIR